jgi:hypothetical protein
VRRPPAVIPVEIARASDPNGGERETSPCPVRNPASSALSSTAGRVNVPAKSARPITTAGPSRIGRRPDHRQPFSGGAGSQGDPHALLRFLLRPSAARDDCEQHESGEKSHSHDAELASPAA